MEKKEQLRLPFEDEPMTLTEHDICVASWKIAALMLGEDDGSIDRDQDEVTIQLVMKDSLDVAETLPGGQRTWRGTQAGMLCAAESIWEDFEDEAFEDCTIEMIIFKMRTSFAESTCQREVDELRRMYAIEVAS